MPNLTGSMIGAHHILQQIGYGGMSTVYIAYQPGLERLVALKVMPEVYTQNPKAVERFAQEARIIARLEHPNIIPIYDFAREGGLTYLTMRYVQAGTAKEILHQGPLSLSDAARILDDIAGALDYAHARGVIHRDVKPANILVDKEGHAYLTDFGIAKLTEGTTELTGTASVGTPAYMAPEQTLNKPITAQSDVYSLGITLFEMLTGRRPFEGNSSMSTALMHVNNLVPSPREFNPTLPEALDSVFQKVLAKDPKERYTTAGEFARAFDEVVTVMTPPPNGEAVEPPPLRAIAADVAAGKHGEEVTQEVRDIIRQRQTSEQRRQIVRRLPLIIGGLVVVGLIAGLASALSVASRAQVSAEQTGVAVVALQNQAATLQAALASGTAPGQEETLSAAFTQLAVQGIALSATSTFTPTRTPTRTPIPTDPPTATATLLPTNTFVPTFTFTPTVVPISFVPGTVPSAVPGDAGLVSGDVLFRNGPVAGATVTLRQASTGAIYGTATTDASGQFTFQGTGPDRWVINATTPDGLTSMFYGNIVGGPCNYFAGRANTSYTFDTTKGQSAFVHVCVVRIGGFEITAPATGEVFPGLIISWTPLEGATNYDIAVQDITDLFKPPFAEDFLTQTTFDYTRKLGGDPTISGHCYLIRIVAHAGNSGPIAVTTTQACRQ
jgi:hypothetical protein